MLRINIKKDFSDDWISRKAGERLREMIVAAADEGKTIEIDFENMMIASTSFFDEGFAKLADLGWTKDRLFSLISFKHLHNNDRLVLIRLCQNRNMK